MNPSIGDPARGDMLWQYSLPVGHLRLHFPAQPLTPEEVDDIEAFLSLIVKQLRRTATASEAKAREA